MGLAESPVMTLTTDRLTTMELLVSFCLSSNFVFCDTEECHRKGVRSVLEEASSVSHGSYSSLVGSSPGTVMTQKSVIGKGSWRKQHTNGSHL